MPLLIPRATDGYAYLTQLVGYSAWRVARRHAEASAMITQHDAQEGMRIAYDEIARRLGKPTADANSYRRILIPAKSSKPRRPDPSCFPCRA